MDVAVAIAKKFLRAMAQRFALKDQKGLSMWHLADLKEY